MLDLAQIANRRTPRSFVFDGETVNIEILPHKITPEYRSKLAALARKAEVEEGEEIEETPEEREQDAKMVADLMPKWDVLAGGEPVEPSYVNLMGAPCTLLGRIASEIMEVIKEHSNPTPKPKSKK